MDNLTIYLVFFGTLLVPSFVALLKWKSVMPEFRPMLAFSWLLLGLETSSVFFDRQSAIAFFSDNFHYLLEMLFVIWIGWRWKIFEGRRGFFQALLVIVFACFIAEKPIFGWIATYSWCRILFSILITLLALDFLHRTFFRESVGRQKNAILLFCMALAGFYLITSFVEIAATVLDTAGTSLVQNLFYLSVVLGTLFNITILISYLCISTKQRFSLA